MIKILKNSESKKIYAIGLLVYPGKVEPKWNYLFGACMIYHQLIKNEWFKKNCDIIILTPEISDQLILSLIKKIFDIHVIYHTSLNTKFPFATNPRWYGVFNKLYYWNKDIFNYNRVLILDTDLFILKPEEYIKTFLSVDGPVAGCYENGFIHNNKDLDLTSINTIIPAKYTYYKWTDNKSYYNMVNAGVISLEPNIRLFNIMLKDLQEGWDKLGSKYPSLKNKKNNFLFPEQEYLTGLFSGQWRSLPASYLSCTSTEIHYSPHGTKYWNKFPTTYSSYYSVVIESKIFISQYEECSIIFKNIINNLSNIKDNNINLYNIDSINNIVIAPNTTTSKKFTIKNINNIINVQNVEQNINNNNNVEKNISNITILNTVENINNDPFLKLKVNDEKNFVGITKFGNNNLNHFIKTEKQQKIEFLSPNKMPIKSLKQEINLNNPDDILLNLNNNNSPFKNVTSINKLFL